MAARRNGRALAVATAPVRCATYGRVSTEDQANKEYSSIEVQRESAAAYVASQRQEGWLLLDDDYSDPGFSGGNTKRPGLQRLLADIEDGKIDVVVVYKYDRLSRSMLDFLQLLDFFKRRGVSFVSVSQRFDTSTPVGEMTLNILLSFAQFERQIIAERTRDKIQAARRRGRWTGGMPPLGYDVVPGGGALAISKDEAQTVRAIFEHYAEKPSLIEVAQELNRRGWRRKSWTTKDGHRREGRPWNRKTLSNLLRNPIYIGQIRLGNEVYDGEHEGIVTATVFRGVQTILAINCRDRGASQRNRHGALLRGLLRCSACDTAMTFAPVRRNGKLHRYYRCQGAQRNGHGACPTKCVRADDIESFVVDQIRRIGSDPTLQDETFRQAVSQVRAQVRGLKVEARRLRTELAAAQANVQRLVEAVSRTTGPAADAIVAELGTAQERVTTIETRQGQIKNELAALDSQALDRDDLSRALIEFDQLWSVLLTPERERVLRLLVERVDYDGGTRTLTIQWRLAGFGQLADETSP